MHWESILRRLLVLQLLLLMFVTVSIVGMDSEAANYFKLYELLGAATASILTTFGLLEMKDLTEGDEE